MKNKDFDCVEMMHKGQAAINRRMRGMSEKEKWEYWRQRNEELRKMQEEARKHRRPPTKN